jgi:putative transposase
MYEYVGMERKVPFVKDEYYHLYSRGVDRRVVFETPVQYQRFLLLLFLCNGKEAVHMANVLRKYQGESLLNIYADERPEESLVHVLAYALMPNHFHLVVKETGEGNISKFMSKVMTAYSMYFNTVNHRSGPLFTRPFRSKHINDDEYLRWVLSYVHLNPLDIYQNNWENSCLADTEGASQFLREYRYGSFRDYYVDRRPESALIAMNQLPFDLSASEKLDDVISILAAGRKNNNTPINEKSVAPVLV